MRKCIICDKEFYKKHAETPTCSKECSTVMRKNCQKEINEKKKEISILKRIKKCITCEKEFDPGKHKQTLNCSKECIKIYNYIHKDERMLKMKLAMKEKYGVEYAAKIPGYYKKVKETKKKNFGDENYSNVQKMKKTCLEKYGVDSYTKLGECQDKTKITKSEKYGDEKFNNREKSKITILEKYGVEHHLQNKEILKKQEETNEKKFGVKYTLLIDDCISKAREKTLENYNVEYYFLSEEHLNKMKNEKIENVTKLLKQKNLFFDSNTYTQLRDTSGIKTKAIYYDITCNKCNTQYKSTLNNRNIICRTCNPYIKSKSKFQEDFKQFLIENNIRFEENTRKIISPLEIYFYFQDEKLGIELNGNYYHSEIAGGKDRKYHINKTNLCFQKDIRLIHIFEDEWLTNSDIIKSEILNIFNKNTNTIHSKDCIIKEINNETKKEFLENNHLQGTSNDSIKLGMFHNNELISVMTFSKNRVSKNNKKDNIINNYELNRFSNKKYFNVIDAFPDFIKFFKNNYAFNSIISYMDCRYYGINKRNNVFYKNGFNFIKKTQCNYFYMYTTQYYARYYRFDFNKQFLLNNFPNSNSNQTEWEIARENGMDRIWDCGYIKFELKNSNQ